MSEYTPEPDDLDEVDEAEDDIETGEVETEDTEPLGEADMTQAQPDQGTAQDDPSYGETPEVDDDA